jgi:hypothetical protein
MKHTAVLTSPQQAHAVLSSLWASIKQQLNMGQRLTVVVKPETRSDPQNRRLWAMLTDVSQQVTWHGQKLAPEDWKAIFTAACKKLRVVPGIEGGMVVIGQSTSRMTKAEKSEMQELMEAFGAEHGVMFRSETAALSAAQP